MFASMPIFFYGLNSYDFEIIKIIIFTIIVMYNGFFAVIIWNDICDVDIDAIVHSDRALPKGKISKKKFFRIAIVFSIFVFVFSYLVNIRCFLFVGIAALFVAFHNKYLRRFVKIKAYSEIITPLQWTIVPIFGFIAIEGSNIFNMFLLIIFTYFADGAHDIPEGIHDAEGDKRDGIKTYATSFGEKTAARISFIMLFLAGITGLILYHNSILTIIFLVPFVSFWLYTLYYSYNNLSMKIDDMRKFGLSTGLKIYRFFLATYVFIFLDIFIRLLDLHYF